MYCAVLYCHVLPASKLIYSTPSSCADMVASAQIGALLDTGKRGHRSAQLRAVVMVTRTAGRGQKRSGLCQLCPFMLAVSVSIHYSLLV
jgi:hypothetical protein